MIQMRFSTYKTFLKKIAVDSGPLRNMGLRPRPRTDKVFQKKN